MLSYSKNGVRIEGYPRNEEAFKLMVVEKRRVHVLQVFEDRRHVRRIWNARQFSATANLRWNLETGYASRKRYVGLIEAHFAIDESDLPSTFETKGGSDASAEEERMPAQQCSSSVNIQRRAGASSSRIQFRELVREDKESETSLMEARALAQQLLVEMDKDEIYHQIRQKDVRGADSKEIQNCLLSFLKANGFQEEHVGLFGTTNSPNVRPDYCRPSSSGRNGIIVEVERGKTTHNNMDMFDIWKCHICDKANYLFLVVPQVRAANGRKEFEFVCKRMSALFRPQNYTNVYGLWLFGY
ncbi:hypothetical protein [Microvirga arsenatis]|uniref:Restriction endonuclease n=1 Tax=Microvirga arsenatis TaxID=2692265 RepID=A0ABW9YUU9_9HYPH|nr:hypothetical protein [Microvirga arsenatis]NBJ10929.1 hypothetical protein [Microvirga arsenatis]NBJ24174.1 hypothetical protein [Microvirga arsenatis]